MSSYVLFLVQLLLSFSSIVGFILMMAVLLGCFFQLREDLRTIKAIFFLVLGNYLSKSSTSVECCKTLA